MKRFFLALLILLTICISFFIYQKSNDYNSLNANNNMTQLDKMENDPVEIVKRFFDAFANADYERMKVLCTQDCINTYFHEGDVFGMVWAKATKIGTEIRTLSETEYSIFVDVEMKAAEVSAYSSKDTSTSFYVAIKKQDDGSWLIDQFTTG